MFSDSELFTAELTTQVLDGFIFAMGTKSNQDMNVLVIEQVVVTKRIGTEESLGGDGFLFAAWTFAHVPGNDVIPARNLGLVFASDLCSAAGAILVGFWLQDASFGGSR